MAVDLPLISDSPVDALVLVLLLDLLPPQQSARALVGSEVGIVLEHVQVLLLQLLLGELPVLVLDHLGELVVLLRLLAVHQGLVLRTPQDEDP
jgi:hypothetical protein